MAASVWLHGPSATRLTEGLLSVLKEQRPEYLPSVLANYREHGVFPTQTASAVGGLVGFSHAKLSSSKTKFEGLCLLSMLVKDSSCDLFQQHCLSWLRSLQQIIQSQAPVQTIQLAVTILKDLLQYSSQLAELAREVGLNCILGILTSLLALKPECELAAMEGMTACMTYYPRACGSLRDKLGAYFLSKMDSCNKKTQEMACQCYGRLPCLGGLMDRVSGAGRAERWINQVHCLLASANTLLTHIYQGSETDRTMQYEGQGVELGFPHLSPSDPLLLLQLQNRYTAVCLALNHTLRVDPASAVRLPVRSILNLVCRALAVSSKSINLTGDGSVRLLLLPVIHTNILEVLSALITVVRSSMVQYAAVLQRLFSQTLSAWMPPPEANPGQQRAYSSVRMSVYRTLEVWVQVAGASASILQGSPSHSELLFSHLLGDITPGADSIKLRAGLSAEVVPGGKPGPRRTKPLVMADAVGPSLQRKGDSLANQDTCLSALRVLRQIILTNGTLLKADVHKRLHNVVLPLCVRLQQQLQSSCSTASETAGGISGQYGGALTRRELYRLLLALVLVPSPTWPPPLTCAVSILSKGRNDRILKPTPSASVLPSPQGVTPGLPLPTLLGGPNSSSPFPARHSLSMGSTSLLSSLENHLSLLPGLTGHGHTPGDMILSPHHHQPDSSALCPPEGQRPVFVRYDKEEAEDVEISLASDSDDSVVIVPPGMLNMEAQQNHSAVTNSNNLAPLTPGGGPAITLPGADSVTMAPTAQATTPMDSVSLATSSPLLTTSTAPVNSFPPQGSSAVSLAAPLNSSTAPTGVTGDSLAGRPQLQQMLMQPSAPPPTSMPLPLHMLGPQGRLLQQQQGPPPSKEDSAVININSTDDEEEDMEDDEDLEEDEEDDEEEVSDFPEEGEFFEEGEEFDEFDEEAEDLEEEEVEEEEEEEEEEEDDEEEEEDGRMPPLEGVDEQLHVGGMPEEEKPDEGAGGGIQEVQPSRSNFGEDKMKVQEVESIGVLEGARGEEEEDDDEERERMDDPSMPQILCVTGGVLEEREEEEEEEKKEEEVEEEEEEEEVGVQALAEVAFKEVPSLEDQGANEVEVAPPPPEEQQETAAEPAQELSENDDLPPVLPNELLAGPPKDGLLATEPATLSGPNSQEPEERNLEKNGKDETEHSGMEGDVGEREDGKGVKRKRDDAQVEEEAVPSPEKKKMDDDAMASMLADFIACPPDDDKEAPSTSTC
ncbi:proline-, glutamic acid- and leucine-rich protein 1-like isoform X2 [Entelurus aequoreus]|uniref:proline-, glutamic acid- and leucine-rich protein 1-like isoform X2 n=1 Tax=Entelurus aequoreus TaxID=161455 RepID=UPI002B1E56BA|nr:proline-, glutamic acid- and leucine-rich protein 1-like isoform X2 [Entelurus aequoreus]